MSDLFFSPVKDGLLVHIRLTPQGRAMGIVGMMKNVHGQNVLKAMVTTAPEDGKANQALIKLLSKEWKVAKSTIGLIQGQTSRHKVLHISGSPKQLANMLDAWAITKGIST